MLTTPFFVYQGVFSVLTYIYAARNQTRGVSFNANDIMALAVGRISSLSSYLYISDNSFNFSAVSDYFSLGIFLERILGFPVLSTNSPSSIFNIQELGNASYSIFLGMNGFLYSLYKASPLIFIFNFIVILFVLFLLFQLMPYFNKKHRVFVFFLVMYMPFLSFDIWEISVVLQSLIVINLLYLLFLCLTRFYYIALGKVRPRA